MPFPIDLPHTLVGTLALTLKMWPWLLSIGVGVYVLTLRVTVLRVILLIAVILGGFWAGVVYLIGYSMARPLLHWRPEEGRPAGRTTPVRNAP